MAGLSAGQTLETALKTSRLLRPSRWPLEQALAKAAGASGVFLHLPAHRRGAGRPPSAVALPWPYDLPELPEIGGPLERDGAIADSQQQVAQGLGAERSWYGVNGASGLLQACLLAAAQRPGQLLLPRNLHRSLLHGCALAGVTPSLYSPPIDPLTGLWQPLPPEQLERLLQQAGPVSLLVLVSPTYQGLASDLPALVAIAHRYGVAVLVDEAHGGHFGFDSSLPVCALAAGADLVVHSVHKSLGGLGQSAALHAQGAAFAPAALEQSLGWLQTSSPSAVLMLSAEQAYRHHCSATGRRQLRGRLQQARALREQLLAAGIPLLMNDDPLRLLLHTGAWGCSGAEADAWLLGRGVIAECPELLSLTFCLGLGSSRGLGRQLRRALQQLRQANGGPPLPPLQPPPFPLISPLALSPKQAWAQPSEVVPLGQASGRIAAELLCPYPPGIPVVVPGERLEAERLEWLQQQQRLWAGQIPDTVRVLV